MSVTGCSIADLDTADDVTGYKLPQGFRALLITRLTFFRCIGSAKPYLVAGFGITNPEGIAVSNLIDRTLKFGSVGREGGHSYQDTAKLKLAKAARFRVGLMSRLANGLQKFSRPPPLAVGGAYIVNPIGPLPEGFGITYGDGAEWTGAFIALGSTLT
jgi:hypothetical protein